MEKKYLSVRGTSDFDSSQSLAFHNLTKKSRETLSLFGYDEIILPILEEAGLFAKGVGQTSDIVSKQMFKIQDKDTVLRPEGTAQVIRYYIQHSLFKQSDFHKFFYIGPMFRGERPQKGRFRQFHHIGVEAIGSDSVFLDAEVISLAMKILDTVGISQKELIINSLGCGKDKEKFSKRLFKDLSQKKNELCSNCQSRLARDPLRVLDCKKKTCKNIVSTLDLDNSCLCKECLYSFEKLLSLLNNLGVEYTYQPQLVRGLDYYTNTVFEIITSGLGAQDAIGAGGRYNNLVKFLGGPQTPAIGFALGVERILLLLNEQKQVNGLDVFIAVAEKDLYKDAFSLLNQLRGAGIISDCDYLNKSLKAQMRVAQKKASKFVIILGSQELLQQKVALKCMEDGSQEDVNLKDLPVKISKLLGKELKQC